MPAKSSPRTSVADSEYKFRLAPGGREHLPATDVDIDAVARPRRTP